jgi:signal transduction histidine kinase/CheY-like chemotaxis protein
MRRPAPLSAYYAFLVAIFIAAAAASLVYIDRQSTDDAIKAARGDAAFASRTAAKALGDQVALLRKSVGSLATNPTIAQVAAHPAGCTLTFSGTDPRRDHLDIVDARGVVLCSSGPHGRATYATAPWLATALRGRTLRGPVIDAATHRPALLYAQAAAGKLAVAGFVDLAALGRTLHASYGGNRPSVFVIANTATHTVVTRSSGPLQLIGTSSAQSLDDAGRIYASAAVAGAPWRLYVGVDRADALAAGTRLRNREAVILLSALSLILLATILVYRKTVSPLKLLSSRVRAATANQGAGQLPVTGPSELQELAAQINALTSAVNTHEAVRRAKEEAEQANEAKSRFLSHMSHELRTPLAAVLGFAELLHRRTRDETERAWTRYILEGGRHLLAIVNELLEISRIEAGKLTLTAAPVDLQAAAAQVLDLVSPLAAERNIHLERTVEDGERTTVLADPLRLKQVLLNLVGNAIKYNREDGSVTLSVRRASPTTAAIAVTDTGRGISPDQIERLFTPFERLGADQGSVGGSGLGLVVSKGIVEAMGGRLDVESELESGTTFTVELALAETAPEPEAPPAPATAGDILYVDDVDENLQLIRRLLAEWRPGLDLRTASGGLEGASLAEERRPDLLLLDLNLPDMAGEELLRRLRARADTVDVPVVVLSADSATRNITRLLESGADAYLTKPVDVPQFLGIVDRLLART